MKKIITSTIMLALLSGCATYGYVQPGKSEKEAKQAEIKCDYDAEKATVYIQNAWTAGFEKANLKRKCMEAEGYKNIEIKK